MASEQFGPYVAYPVAADLSAAQYRIVQIVTDGAGNAALNLAGANQGDGVLVDDPRLGSAIFTGAPNEKGTVQVQGVAKVNVGPNAAGIAVGGYVTSDANGYAIAATTGSLTGSRCLGKALQTPTANNQIIPVLLQFAGLC